MDRNLLERATALGSMLRPTPVVPLDHERVELFAKLEHLNPVGSTKDRSALWILQRAIARGEITPNTTVVESSSGNFACALATFCRMLRLRFVPVIDPLIMAPYESLLRSTCDTVVKVEKPDDSGGYLKTRLNKVAEIRASCPDSFWPNQYGNTDAMDAHYRQTAPEICEALPELDYAFIGVSSGGTIAGLSRRLREHYRSIRIVAVDVVGSVVFGGPPKRRRIPGIGSSIRPDLLRHAHIDDVCMVTERDSIAGCLELLSRHRLFVGGSSGSAYAAIQQYPWPDAPRPPRVVFLCCDRGTPYIDTVYNAEWVARLERTSDPPAAPLRDDGPAPLFGSR